MAAPSRSRSTASRATACSTASISSASCLASTARQANMKPPIPRRLPPYKDIKMTQVAIYDTTLRDGTQREGISLSVADKLKITRLLDDLGVSYIEGGWPGSNPKD